MGMAYSFHSNKVLSSKAVYTAFCAKKLALARERNQSGPIAEHCAPALLSDLIDDPRLGLFPEGQCLSQRILTPLCYSQTPGTVLAPRENQGRARIILFRYF